jgi:hypothetical protein
MPACAFAVERAFNERWKFRTRVAGRFSSEQDGSNVYLRGYAPSRTGTEFGDVTLDEAYIGYTAADDGMRLRVGRFQTQFALPGVPSKGLDRNDSPNIDVNWTDGVHLDLPVAGDWRGHLIAEHRHRRGSGGVTRAPLDFSDSDSRVSMFAGLQNTKPWGPVDHRMLSLSWMPASLASEGLASPVREDYLTADARDLRHLAVARGRPAAGRGSGSRLCVQHPVRGGGRHSDKPATATGWPGRPPRACTTSPPATILALPTDAPAPAG